MRPHYRIQIGFVDLSLLIQLKSSFPFVRSFVRSNFKWAINLSKRTNEQVTSTLRWVPMRSNTCSLYGLWVFILSFFLFVCCWENWFALQGSSGIVCCGRCAQKRTLWPHLTWLFSVLIYNQWNKEANYIMKFAQNRNFANTSTTLLCNSLYTLVRLHFISFLNYVRGTSNFTISVSGNPQKFINLVTGYTILFLRFLFRNVGKTILGQHFLLMITPLLFLSIYSHLKIPKSWTSHPARGSPSWRLLRLRAAPLPLERRRP